MTAIPLTLSALRTAYADGTTPAEVIDQVYNRIETVDDPGIFIHRVERRDALDAAAALGPFDPSKPLWGVPYVLKDNIDVAGLPTTAACPEFAYTAENDAFVVDLLRAAGALLIGKTNLDQFATGLVGVRSPFPPPRNALDPTLVPGGSSSGSAVAVAQGIAAFSLGTDTAGSGRVPAAMNNIVGLKPTLGTLSATGLVPACRTLDTISIFALTVDDAYRVFEALNAFDAADSYARSFPAETMRQPMPGCRIGVPGPGSARFFGDGVQEDAFVETLTALRGLGAETIDLDFTLFYEVADLLYEGAWVAERYAAIEPLLRSNPEALFPVTRQIICQAERFSSADTFRGFYRLQHLKRQIEPVLASVDMLCVPSIPTFYSLDDLSADPVGPNSNLGTYTNFVNLLDMCGMAVPTGNRSDGRPGSVTLLAPAGQDGRVASMARMLEAASSRSLGATPWLLAQTDLPETPSEPDEIELAVCGAHMSGLPLNGELTGRGGRFVRRARTSDSYTFHALAGGPPFRPGLVKRGNGSGQSIALEIWALPKTEFGGFVETIPHPLGIGTLDLSDGTTVKGFICETSGTEGSRDISHLGDWRRYISEMA